LEKINFKRSGVFKNAINISTKIFGGNNY